VSAGNHRGGSCSFTHVDSSFASAPLPLVPWCDATHDIDCTLLPGCSRERGGGRDKEPSRRDRDRSRERDREDRDKRRSSARDEDDDDGKGKEEVRPCLDFLSGLLRQQCPP
jgi:hypothetical protein